jgi:hypothetical protein
LATEDLPMRRRRATAVLLVIAACSGAEAEHAGSEETPTAWSGPPVHGDLEVMESQPPQYAVAVRVDAPTGGHELQFVDVAGDPARPEVRFQLTVPGQDEFVTQARTELIARARLASRPDRVEIRISTVQRGVHYFQAPPFELASVLRPR